MSKTILDHAKEILYERKEEKERQYGPIKESMQSAAQIASILASKKLSPNDCYAVVVGIKLARQGHHHKSDNILDAIVYLAQMNDENETLTDFTTQESFEKAKTDLEHAKRTNKVSAKLKGSRKKTNSNSGRKTGKTTTWHGRAKSISRK